MRLIKLPQDVTGQDTVFVPDTDIVRVVVARYDQSFTVTVFTYHEEDLAEYSSGYLSEDLAFAAAHELVAAVSGTTGAAPVEPVIMMDSASR